MSEKLIFYGTSACHLCEDALSVVAPIIQARGISLIKIDIADDDNLLARYGLRIPVIAYRNMELGWPFGLEQVSALLGFE